MRKIYNVFKTKYHIDTSNYNYSKIKVGSKVVCINDSIICYASFPRFGETYVVNSIDEKGLFVNDDKRYKDGYIDQGIKYLGTIKYTQEHKYSNMPSLFQEHEEWIQRFILLEDWIKINREQKLKRIFNDVP